MPKKEPAKTVKVKYAGRHASVVHGPTGEWKQGEVKELPAPAAEALISGNANFKEVKSGGS